MNDHFTKDLRKPYLAKLSTKAEGGRDSKISVDLVYGLLNNKINPKVQLFEEPHKKKKLYLAQIIIEYSSRVVSLLRFY